MSLKHRIKMRVRDLYARALFHTGLTRVVERLTPPRLVILAGHCVAPESGFDSGPGAHLPADMKIGERTLERLLEWIGKRYPVGTIGEGYAALANGGLERTHVALSMDDGYRDNHRVLLPLLRRHGARATIFLESRPLDERRVNWSHKLFWLLGRISLEDFVHRYGDLTQDEPTFHACNQVLAQQLDRPLYRVKRALKYDAEPQDRDRVVDALFAQEGGDEAALCDELYMTWDEARELRDAGVELGGHTVNHPILSRLAPDDARAEIHDGARALERALGAAPVTFAYPWGRRWDFDDASRSAVEDAGFTCAVTMHAGANHATTDRLALHRLAIADDAALHLIACEICGGFELLRRLGLDLSE